MPDTDRKGPWVISPSGKRWYILDPRPEDFEIEDIAHNLSRLNRFNGAVDYTVAEHSIAVSRVLSRMWDRPDLALQGLLHDAAEAVIGDIVSPLKALLPEIKGIEAGIWKAIATRFDLPPELDPLVIRVDQELAAVEGYQFFNKRTSRANKWWQGMTFGPEKSSIRHAGVVIAPRYGNASVKSEVFLGWYRDLTRNSRDA